MRVTGVDACRRGWVAVTLEGAGWPADQSDGTERAGHDAPPPGPAPIRVDAVRVHATLAGLLDGAEAVVGIDMPLGLLESGWREADRAARGLLGPRRSSVFAIPPRAVWAQADYQAASQLCRKLTGQGFSIQAWGLRAKLLEADWYRGSCRHPLYEVHPELAFSAMAGAPLAHSKHTAAGRDLRRDLLCRAGIALPADSLASVPMAPVTDVMDAAAVAWSAWRIAAGRAITLPDRPQHDRHGREIAIRY
jgi:predicted RNase H-like nuclease